MVGSGDYTAEQLAFRAGVPLRTVRFYVQEKLIDPPLGRGRGAHFTNDHLVQLQQARVLQNAGFALETIREKRTDLSLGLLAMAGYNAMRDSWLRRQSEPEDDSQTETEADTDEAGGFDAAAALRIPMAEGVDLLISQDRRLPSPKQLVDLALYIRKLFGPA
jgi:DNA-binding transcriptional MerR regulator